MEMETMATNYMSSRVCYRLFFSHISHQPIFKIRITGICCFTVLFGAKEYECNQQNTCMYEAAKLTNESADKFAAAQASGYKGKEFMKAGANLVSELKEGRGGLLQAIVSSDNFKATPYNDK